MTLHRWATPAAVACGLVALAARPVALDAVVVTTAVGAIGVAGSRPGRAEVGRGGAWRWGAATALGIAAFAAASGLGPAIPTVVTAWGLGASLVAAVAEEAFFRGLLQTWLVPWGEGLAVVATAAAFAAIHVPVYGLSVLPLDFAAGLLLGWQRSVTGGWSAPALTHAVANLLQVSVV